VISPSRIYFWPAIILVLAGAGELAVSMTTFRRVEAWIVGLFFVFVGLCCGWFFWRNYRANP
jgi:hypothetical protein